MRRWGVVLATVWAAACITVDDGRAQTVSAEDSVKATFLQRFASFVTWPDGAFTAADSPIQICVLGSEPFRELAQTTSRDQLIGGRALNVRTIADPTAAPSCHILFATGAMTDEALRAAQQAPVLTVTDGASHRGGRGIIHFAVVDNRVRFHIDDALADASRLSISSRLLTLALSVRRRSGE